MADLPTVTVVVPSRRGGDRLAAVLEPLVADPATTELVVVLDGASSTPPVASHGAIRTITTPGIGKQAACAAALDGTAGDVVLFVDDDVVAAGGLVSGHAAHHAGEEGLVVVGYTPVVLPARRGPGEGPSRLYAREYEGHCRRLESGPDDPLLVGLWGGNVSLRRPDCLHVGLVSPAFPDLYHEDREFGLRCLRAGLRGRFDRRLVAAHHHHRDIDTFLADARSQGAGVALLGRLHGDLVSADVTLPPRGLRWACRSRRGPLRLAGLARAASARGRFGVEDAALRAARRVAVWQGAAVALDGSPELDRLARHHQPDPREASPCG